MDSQPFFKKNAITFEPLSGRQFPRYSGIKSFFRLPVLQSEIHDKGHINSLSSWEFDLGIFGTPFDGGVSYRPGARFAPSQIRECSSLGRGFHWSRGVHLFSKLKIADLGDCSTVPIDLQQTYLKIENFVQSLLDKQKKFISVGGDHSTTLPILRALKKKYGAPLQLIHFDAHLDTYPAAWGCEYHHGSFLRHALNEGLVEGKKTYQFGIRGPLAGADDLDFVKKHQVHVFTMDDLRQRPLPNFLSQFSAFDQTPTYVSFDIDCLDPAYAPGTGTPVPGGLTTYETQQLLRYFKIPNLVGADLVEVCPAYDPSEITGIAAVDILFELMHLMAL